MIDAALASWVDACLAAAGRTPIAPLTLFRERAWATVHSVATDAGTVWLKVPAPASRAEVGLYPLLARVVPERVLAPLGVDEARGWLLLPDGGVAVGDRFAGGELRAVMTRAVAQYADLQQAVAPHVDALLAAGVPDMRPAAMPARFAEALAGTVEWVAARGTARDRTALERLRALAPRYEQWCLELGAAPGSASIDHGDLHARNIIGGGTAAGFEARFWDWGDSLIAHPFASLLFVLETTPAPDRAGVRDAYLARFGDPARLQPVAALAVRVAQVSRALVYLRAIGVDVLDHPLAAAPFAHLRRLLDF